MDNQVNQPWETPTYGGEIRCSNCGSALVPGQAFCANCGAPAPTPAATPCVNICSNCGNYFPENADFCPNCGNRKMPAIATVNPAVAQYNTTVVKNKKKKPVVPIIAGVLVVVAIIAGVLIDNAVKEQKAAEEARILAQAVEDYKETAKDFYLKVLDSGTTMEDIGNEIEDSWYAYVKSTYYRGKRYYSVDSAVAGAQIYMYSEISAVETSNSTIESLYRQLLVVPDTSNQLLLEIKEAVKQTYDAYKDMYDCVIDPTGSYNTWTDEFGDTDTELADAVGKLADLLY